ncbi:NAD(P)H-quinone oxidoreductase subunit 5 [Marinobacter daqiaonensis]|uniref:Probable inorganic carbon transporter subunit DabB n=1 Tax=Marinobacter daqiaonensis TaxID=650891 RepID=A0A1I6I563_9GAMM|nr:NADH-quinone oxidoreductase subunit L [Marinobacter daqiaonensis]SFR61843.1 NAD(P)H-quinone oxidoreductase subunit 5 [Marinobacter daqiaonensis]
MPLSSTLMLTIPALCFLAGLWSGSSGLSHSRLAQWQQRLGQYLWLPLPFLLVLMLTHPESAADLDILSLTPLTLVMLALVTGMAFVLMRFSRHYMAGDPRLPHYYRWFWLTLGSVSLTIMANHLLLFWFGWMTISLCLHRLLTHYPERPRAVLAAHKKFILARTAELALLAAFTMLHLQHQTFLIDELRAHFSQPGATLSWQDQVAAGLIAIAALIKCAQLPVHGWLIQVVEAPTPVSALLHAGVINLGGFLLILFAPLLMLATAAQWLILIVAGLSTVLAALIMTTRVSQKVRLAWSTCAQMGLMLVECALGLFELALLHLLAHSAYKAYAFLNSGSAVYDDIQQRLAPAAVPSSVDWSVAAVIAASAVGVVAALLNPGGAWSPWLLLALALTMLIAQRRSTEAHASLAGLGMIALTLSLVYGLLKTAMAPVLESSGIQAAPASGPADVWGMLMFTTLFALGWLLRYQFRRPRTQHLYTALYAGLYLDEWFTRATLRIWPVRLPVNPRQKQCDLDLSELDNRSPTHEYAAQPQKL